MSKQENLDITKKFELYGSTAHYPSSLSFTIDYMILTIQPDLKSKDNNLVNCMQQLDISAKYDNINEIELDIAELKIHSVSSSDKLCRDNKKSNNKDDNNKELFFMPHSKKDKLTIRLGEPLQEGSRICITIKYSAGVYGIDYTLGRKPPKWISFYTT
jgi:hypothetical protein